MRDVVIAKETCGRLNALSWQVLVKSLKQRSLEEFEVQRGRRDGWLDSGEGVRESRMSCVKKMVTDCIRLP
eukprot:765810-Hanusia_phi.AAC.4